MSYETPRALRMALEQRLLNQSNASGIGLDRLRRRVVFERIVARLEAAMPRVWVLKGGMALEVRLGDAARLTKDIDLGLRARTTEHDLRDRLIEALGADLYADGFAFATGPLTRLNQEDSAGVTFRSKVSAHLADKPFGRVQLDISPRDYELDRTDVVPLPNSLAFAGVHAPNIEIVDVHRHAAEKCHAMLQEFGDRENTRVRDLVDLVILCEHGQIDPIPLRDALQQVWSERTSTEPPTRLPTLPTGWPDRYERIAAEHHVDASSYPQAVAVIDGLWALMFDTKEA